MIRYLILILILLVGCSKNDTSPIPPKPVDPCQKANAGADKSIKKGEVVEIGLNDETSLIEYTWYPKDAVVSPKGAHTRVSPLVSMIFMLKAKTSCEVSYDFVRVTVQ